LAITGDGGQIQTVEAITAAIILLSIIALVIEATSVTPLTSSFTSQHVKLELQNIGTDILTALDETPKTGSSPYQDPLFDPTQAQSQLKYSITAWLSDTGGYDWFACTNSHDYQSLLDPSHSTQAMDTPLARTLSLVLLQKSGIAYNVDIRYPDQSGNIKDTKMIWNGDPSDNSVTVSRYVVLNDDDVHYYANQDYVVPDFDTSSNFHNVVEVRLTMWVM